MWISSKKFDEMSAAAIKLNNALQESNRMLEEWQSRAYLVSIQRTGRLNKFTFMRNGSLEVIETMGLISDDLTVWKDKLLK